jgi:hypothetical protein
VVLLQELHGVFEYGTVVVDNYGYRWCELRVFLELASECFGVFGIIIAESNVDAAFFISSALVLDVWEFVGVCYQISMGGRRWAWVFLAVHLAYYVFNYLVVSLKYEKCSFFACDFMIVVDYLFLA